MLWFVRLFVNYFIFISLSSATKHVMPREFSAKWRMALMGTECPNSRFPGSPCYMQTHMTRITFPSYNETCVIHDSHVHAN